ncbi:MAG TPA: hypothetical protein VHT34_09075, partial [Clostridia bacterium]|nr:hypothetical protein [Clostridia bacterium]
MPMTLKKLWSSLAVVLLIFLSLMVTGCQRSVKPSFKDEFKKTDVIFSKSQMFHIKQVVEFYDGQGNPLPHYYELWIYKDRALAYELDSEGNILKRIQDEDDLHITYQPDTFKAEKHKVSQIFSLSTDALANMNNYTVTAGESYEYCDRSCHVYGMSNQNETDDLRLYIDDQTGYVLFCDAPLFSLKTAFF